MSIYYLLLINLLLQVYKEIMNVFPKVKMIPTSMWQEEFQHYPIQQDCGVNILHQMEYWGMSTSGKNINIENNSR